MTDRDQRPKFTYLGHSTVRCDLPGGEVILVASGPLGSLYAAALKSAGCSVLQADADEAVRAGLFEAAKRLGWIGAASKHSTS